MNGFLSATVAGGSQTRMQQWTTALPDAGPLAYLWHWICQIGLGAEITWSEVHSWSKMTGIIPTGAESQAIVHLSSVWLSERIRGGNKDELPKWMPE